MIPERDIDFHEWRQEISRLNKARPVGGAMTPISPFGAGRQIPTPGAPGNIDPGPSQYDLSSRLEPQPWIDDVSMDTDWLSPQQPIWPMGPPGLTQPRSWDYPIGYNLNYVQARMESLRMFRALARSWGVLSTIITTRQDQLMRIPWKVQRKDKPQVRSAGVDQALKFLRSPDGQHRYTQWANKLLFDLLEIDAPTIYFLNDRIGRPLKAIVMDGTMFFPLIDDMGLRPSTEFRLSSDGSEYLLRQPAFQQIVKGMPLLNLDESELMYVPMRPRPDMPMFGYPGTEQITVETTEAIRKTFYQLNFWAEGTIPDLIVTVPDNWSPRQIAMFQAHFDAVMSGNLQIKSKVRFMPGGMKPFDIKNSSGESLWSQRDETLIRLACYAYSVSPTPFIKQVNRSVAQNAQESAEQEGLYPLMSYWKDNIIDPILERLGLDDIEFVFLPRPERDSVKQASVLDTYVRRGIFNRNQALEQLGEQPIPGGEVHTIELGNAIIPVEDAANGLALPMGTTGNPSPSRNSDLANGSTPRTPTGATPQRGTPRPNHEAPVAKMGFVEVDEAAAQADGDVRHNSHNRLKAGNYLKGHIRLGGLDISIENQLGSVRGKRNPDGSVRWANEMPAHYGYIRGTVGADGDQVDVFVGRWPDRLERVWVVDQMRLSRKGNVKFDEHKILLGYKNLKKALQDYDAAYGTRMLVGNVTELSLDELKTWLKESPLRDPLAGRFGVLVKSDTISLSTNLSSQGRRKKRKRSDQVHELQIH